VERGPIEWCTREITSRCPGFRFTHVDLRNAAYNPDGSLEAETFAFPYEDDAFDLVFGFSLFTHLMPAALEHYLNEIKRVLDDRGRLHATFFVLDQVRKRRLSDSDAEIAKAVMSTEGPAHTAYEIAEWMVLYDEDWLRSVLSAVGLRLRLVNYGSWPEWALGLEDVMGPQDTLVSYVSDVAARSRGA
jgi:SAM-dependent methyltransferase